MQAALVHELLYFSNCRALAAIDKLTSDNRHDVLSLITTPYRTLAAQFLKRQAQNQQAILQYMNALARIKGQTARVLTYKANCARAKAQKRASVFNGQHSPAQVKTTAKRYVARNKMLSAAAKQQLDAYELKLAKVVAIEFSCRKRAIKARINAIRQTKLEATLFIQ